VGASLRTGQAGAGAVASHPGWRWLILSCSVAEGRGDSLSDLDLGLAADIAAWPQILAEVPSLVANLGESVAVLHHRIAEWGDRPHRRTFVQYADGVQLDLVVMPEGESRGVTPGTVVLYDRTGRLEGSHEPDVLVANPDHIYEWTFLGWTALADLTKYLRRESLWEALERLHDARTQIWRLWGAAQDVRYPAFGLTSVLDEPDAGLPTGMEKTVAGLDASDILSAARTCSDLLSEVSATAASATGAVLPVAMSEYVKTRLSQLA
jgi:hypothetical protein